MTEQVIISDLPTGKLRFVERATPTGDGVTSRPVRILQQEFEKVTCNPLTLYQKCTKEWRDVPLEEE